MGAGATKNLKKVDIEIYFWYGGNGDVGHVSLYIVESFLYISFWPETSTKPTKSVGSVSNTYAEDKRYKPLYDEVNLRVNFCIHHQGRR